MLPKMDLNSSGPPASVSRVAETAGATPNLASAHFKTFVCSSLCSFFPDRNSLHILDINFSQL